jgi:methylated-DNA-[protein]-cysteine S-methyltransferase
MIMKQTNALFFSELDSPVGTLLLRGDGQALTGLYMHEQRHRPELPVGAERNDSAFRQVREQLKAYFAGKLQEFELTLAGEGSDFQRKVWRALCKIPFGETESYGGLAKRLGNPNASRAVGLANGSNPIPLVIPCHRVIGADGALTGFGGGLPIKSALLELERARTQPGLF